MAMLAGLLGVGWEPSLLKLPDSPPPQEEQNHRHGE